jgi:hypothetical protein
MNYKVGDFVTFHSKYEIMWESKEDENGNYPFATCDVTPDMLEELEGWYDNEIASIDDYGNIKFEDFPWTWPVEVISGLSPDQRKDND